MSFKKQDIYKALETITAPGEGKSLIENKNITNVVTFGNEVMVDVTISNPTLQAKKKIESEIIKAIKTNVDENIDVRRTVKLPFPDAKFSNPCQNCSKYIISKWCWRICS